MKKNALVLSGGGFKGAFELGALKYIRENWKSITGLDSDMHFEIVAGVSVGALNGAMVAMNKFPELEKLWDNVKLDSTIIYTSDIIQCDNNGKLQIKSGFLNTLKGKFFPSWSWLTIGWNAIFGKEKERLEFEKNFKKFRSVADNTPLFNQLQGLADVKAIQNNGTVFMCGFVNLDDGAYYKVISTDIAGNSDSEKNQNLAKAICASASMPIAWSPIEVPVNQNGQMVICKNAVDGGVRNVSPLGDIIDLINEDQNNEYRIFIINCNSGEVLHETPDEVSNIASIAFRSMDDIAVTEIFNGDISEFININSLVKQADGYVSLLNAKGEKLKSFDYYLINPETQRIGDTLDSTPAMIDDRIKHGYEKAKKEITEPSSHLDHLRELKQTKKELRS